MQVNGFIIINNNQSDLAEYKTYPHMGEICNVYNIFTRIQHSVTGIKTDILKEHSYQKRGYRKIYKLS